MIKTILIANRGEIACRIINTAKKIGIKTIAVYSDADRSALHTQLANQACYLGPAPANDSYLNIPALIAIATQTKADAIHPGYGFLAENAEFARACDAAGLIFIGPKAETITALGSKSTAKNLMQNSGVPVLPGYHGEDDSLSNLQQQADNIGYPVLIKASAGGGGKGMRIVDTPEQLADAVSAAKREAEKSFADDSILLEKYLAEPRHIEIQVCFDNHGNGVHLFSRDCSIQRRYQKIIEEAPAPGISNTMESKMGELAVKAAKNLDYRGVGTFEFLVDNAHNFYFMEMNTRLQVEHPVTEMITGIDLVEWQILIAAGEPLSLQQQDLAKKGHAIEARLYAEDPDTQPPEQRFMPATGTLSTLSLPEQSPYIRVDNGLQAGDMITPYYDPMLAKVIAWDSNRSKALAHLDQGLAAFKTTGIKTNRNFLRRILQSKAFSHETVTTHFLQQHGFAAYQPSDEDVQQAYLLAALFCVHRAMVENPKPKNLWHQSAGWRLNQAAEHRISLQLADSNLPAATVHITAALILPASAEASSPSPVITLAITSPDTPALTRKISGTLQWHKPFSASLEASINKQQLVIPCHFTDNLLCLFFDNYNLEIVLNPPPNHGTSNAAGNQQDRAPMNGRITHVHCHAQQSVQAGQAIISMEAMKMEYTLRAPDDGVISKLLVNEGDLVEEGTLLFQFTDQQHE